MYQGGMAVGGIFTSEVNKDWTLQGQGQEPSLQGPGQGQGLHLLIASCKQSPSSNNNEHKVKVHNIKPIILNK